MKKIKIAQFVGHMNCGGTETMLMNLFRNIDKSKYQFTFIENNPQKSWYSDEITEKKGEIIKVKEFSFRGIFSYYKELVNLFKTQHFDVVHSHVFLHSGIVMLAAKRAGVKIRISHSHSAMRKDDNSLLKKFFLRFLLLRYSTKILACSTEAGICLFGKKFLNRGIVVPNPVQLDKINDVKLSEVNKIRDEYCISKDQLVLGHIGRLVEVKNHKFLIELAKNLKQQNVDFKMFFVGDGPLKETIREDIRKLNLEDNIIMTGNITNVYQFMRIFDIFLLPSFYEGLPVTLIEAQASGVYSIVSDQISKESDLGLDLMCFMNINEIDGWLKKILSFSKINVSRKRINKVIDEKKYSVTSLLKEYENIYD